MKQNSSDQRLGFHSIESILIHNPEKIKKILLQPIEMIQELWHLQAL
jgi:hypothetical protein